VRYFPQLPLSMKHNAKSPTQSARALSNESASNDIKARENSVQPIVFDLRQHESQTVENEDAYGPDPENTQAWRTLLRLAWYYLFYCCVALIILVQTHPKISAVLQKWFASLFKL